MTTIYVDADACPVKAEIERVADRLDLEVVMVANTGLRPSRNPRIRNVTVGDGFDEADDWIAEAIGPDDLCITADVPLADRCVEKGALALSPKGRIFDAQSTGMALAMRNLGHEMREATQSQTYNPPFTKADRSAFLQALDRAARRQMKS